MRYIIILCLMITGCSSGGGSSEETTVVIQTEPLTFKTIFYGDSIGRQLEESDHGLDFVFDTEPGRELTELTFTPQGNVRKNTIIDYSYDLIYIALGTNDKDMAAAELHLIQLLDGYQDKIICVLPMTIKDVEAPFRSIMKEHCNNIIDPLEYGVYPLNTEDRVHLSDTDGGDNIRHYGSIF